MYLWHFFNDDAWAVWLPRTAVLRCYRRLLTAHRMPLLLFEIDFHLRQYNASALSFMVFDGTEYRPLASDSGQNYTGDAYSDGTHAVIDISAYRATNNRIAIRDDDGSTWAWWAAAQFQNYGAKRDDERRLLCAPKHYRSMYPAHRCIKRKRYFYGC